MSTAYSSPQPLRLWLGSERDITGHGDDWTFGVGALLGVLVLYAITHGWCARGFIDRIGSMFGWSRWACCSRYRKVRCRSRLALVDVR